MTDMERLIAAADALADAVDNPDQSEGGLYHYRWHRIDDALDRYHAAREAITKGTPPAFATNA